MTARSRLSATIAALAIVLSLPSAAAAASDCSGRAVLVTLPGITWADVQRVAPPALQRATEEGASGSVSVRTIASPTSYGSGFATIGAGARMEATGAAAAAIPVDGRDGALTSDVRVPGLQALRALADEAGYNAAPGALGSALGAIPAAAIGNAAAGRAPPSPAGEGRFVLLAAMDEAGVVDAAAVGSNLLENDPAAPFGVRTDENALLEAVDAVLERECAFVVIDPGDLIRADLLAGLGEEEAPAARDAALTAADRIIDALRDRLDFARDLLLIVSPTSPAGDDDQHLGVAVAVGRPFEPGSALVSASTRREGVVTLPDVAPTVLRHLGASRPAAMIGRPFDSTGSPSGAPASAVALDAESVFVDRWRGTLSTAFVVFQVLVYLLVVAMLGRGRERGNPVWRSLQVPALAVVAFPLTTYLAGFAPAQRAGIVWFTALLIGIDLALVALSCLLMSRRLDRLLLLVGLSAGVIGTDLMTGSHLQLNTVFGYSPIVAGRFTGAGNIAFAVLGTSGLLAGALLVHRAAGARWALGTAAVLFALVVVIDGAPQFGSDVGGVMALVPALALTWLLLADKRPSLRFILISLLAAGAVIAVFLAIDLARPPGEQTHLARLFSDMRQRGLTVLADTIERKVRANLRVFTSTIWTFFIPPALAALGYLLVRPSGRWREFAESAPRLRHGLVGGLILALAGFAVNDSGIVIPAVVLSFLVPMALLIHLALQDQAAPL